MHLPLIERPNFDTQPKAIEYFSALADSINTNNNRNHQVVKDSIQSSLEHQKDAATMKK